MVDHNHVILKQFRELAIRDLLYRQAELCDLQYDLADQSRKDANSPEEKIRWYDREWVHLRYAAGGDGRQWQLALLIREKIQYYSAIRQYQEIEILPRPSSRRRKIVHSYTHSATLGGDCDLLGRDLKDEPPYPSIFSGHNNDDLLFLGYEPGDDDFLTKFLVGPALRALHCCWRPLREPVPDLESQDPGHRTALYEYSDGKIRIVTHTLGSVVSTIIPMISIVVLYFAKSMSLRLGLVCIFSVIFSIVMSLATNARRVDIFAAAAAFASVQVVFISTAPAF
ncbi:hypothetical protein F4818DRAFT_76629 [Hypoxylon cercidicola]|nr:hypothetical protein F4818DRAFT_76629 [Hypoxylon cercidicola]